MDIFIVSRGAKRSTKRQVVSRPENRPDDNGGANSVNSRVVWTFMNRIPTTCCVQMADKGERDTVLYIVATAKSPLGIAG